MRTNVDVSLINHINKSMKVSNVESTVNLVWNNDTLQHLRAHCELNLKLRHIKVRHVAHLFTKAYYLFVICLPNRSVYVKY